MEEFREVTNRKLQHFPNGEMEQLLLSSDQFVLGMNAGSVLLHYPGGKKNPRDAENSDILVKNLIILIILTT